MICCGGQVVSVVFRCEFLEIFFVEKLICEIEIVFDEVEA